MKNSRKMLVGLSFCTLMFVGCGAAKLPETIGTTTISIDKDGGITSYLVEEFNKEYYDVSELQKMAAEDVAAYNAEHQDGEIPLTLVEVSELTGENAGKVMVQHKYNSEEAYAEYNEGEFFYGTVEEALLADYDLSALLLGVKDQIPLGQEMLMEKPDKTYILITDAKGVIYCPRKITHVSDDVIYQEDGSVDTTQSAGVVVVLMK
ncbi:MAG: hypothetical protein J6A94_11500 [Lachnospiraceae bacterium]|nr:hypothetical protein [Lachnospiraceae bacterium]